MVDQVAASTDAHAVPAVAASDQVFVQSLSYISVDQLYKVVTDAGQDAMFKAIEPIKAACIKEMKTFCPIEYRAADLVSRQFNEGAGFSVTIVAETCRYVGYCLAKNADALSSLCKDTMMNSLMVYQDPWSMPPPTPTATVFTPPPGPWTKEPPGWPGEAEKYNHGGRRHVRRPDDDDDPDDRSTTAGVEIYVINNGGGHHGGQGGGRLGDRHYRHHDDDSVGIHPAVWALILPFFGLGVYVTIKHAIAFIKKRRCHLPVAVRTGDYEPLRTTDPSS
jgi:hypothetical protein